MATGTKTGVGEINATTIAAYIKRQAEERRLAIVKAEQKLKKEQVLTFVDRLETELAVHEEKPVYEKGKTTRNGSRKT